MSCNLWTCALFVAVALLVFEAKLSAGNEEAHTIETDDNKLNKNESRIFSIPSWSSYMRSFNKRYSSLSQQLLRQKLFIARGIEVFLTRMKYKLSQLSYYTAINEYSDSTPDECRRKLSGNQDDDDEDDASSEPALDDEEAEKLLLEMVNERQIVDRNEESLSNLGLRKRRSAPTSGGVLSDLRPRIRWKVPSDNPDYEPIHLADDEAKDQVHRERIANDIPANRVDEIEIGTYQNQYRLAELASQGFGRVKNIIGGAMDLFSQNQSEITEPVDGYDVGGEGKLVPEPETVVLQDWRRSGCIGPIRNQGDCLSCYAVSATAFMEWALCRERDNQLTPLSVQYMVSCGPQYKLETGGRVKLDGCEQGSSRQTVDFIREYGIELEDNMPYMERDTPCPLAPYTPRKKKGYIRPNTKPVIRLKPKTTQLDLALTAGPVIVGMREAKNFLAYGGGMVEHCYQRGGHAMLIVGSMIENGEEYLLIMNSFGSDWGYGGYFKFKRSSIIECVKEFIVPRVNFPGKKAQQRRIKAYLAGRQTNSGGEIQEEEDEHPNVASIFA